MGRIDTIISSRLSARLGPVPIEIKASGNRGVRESRRLGNPGAVFARLTLSERLSPLFREGGRELALAAQNSGCLVNQMNNQAAAH